MRQARKPSQTTIDWAVWWAVTSRTASEELSAVVYGRMNLSTATASGPMGMTTAARTRLAWRRSVLGCAV